MDDMGKQEEWLSSILGASTKRHYKRDFERFLEFSGLTPEEVIEKRKIEGQRFTTRLVLFYEDLKGKGLSQNSARTATIAVTSYLSYWGLSLKIGRKLPSLHMKLESYRPTLKDLQEVYRLNDLKVKAWLLLARDCPARLHDSIRIAKRLLKNPESEFLLKSEKEGVIGKCYFSPETLEIFAKKPKLPFSQRGIGMMLDSAAKTAKIPHLNPHLLRKYWFTVGLNCGISEIPLKILTFKSVPQTDLTYYLDSGNLREQWQKVVDAIPLERSSNGNGRVLDLEETLDKMGIALAKALVKMAKKELREEGVLSMMTKDELDPLKDWKEIILNYITFDEVIPPQPKRRKD